MFSQIFFNSKKRKENFNIDKGEEGGKEEAFSRIRSIFLIRKKKNNFNINFNIKETFSPFVRFFGSKKKSIETGGEAFSRIRSIFLIRKKENFNIDKRSVFSICSIFWFEKKKENFNIDKRSIFSNSFDFFDSKKKKENFNIDKRNR